MAEDQTELEYLRADHVLEFPYQRCTGAILGAFFTEIRDNQKFLGVKTSSGRVICPPVEVDPDTLDDLGTENLVEVGPSGVVTSWTWLDQPRPKNPMDKAGAWALIQLDGADTGLMHMVDAGSESAMKTGMRVKATFIDEPKGDIHDIACFGPEGGARSGTKPVKSVMTPISIKFDYTPGEATTRFLRSVKKGQLIGSKCPDTGKIYVPPRNFSVETASPMTEIVDVPDTGYISTYCIVNIKFYEQVLDVPYAYAYIILDGTDLPIMHLLQECEIADIHEGMRVEAVWKDSSEWTESMENISHFKPTGEPDVDVDAEMDKIRSKTHA